MSLQHLDVSRNPVLDKLTNHYEINELNVHFYWEMNTEVFLSKLTNVWEKHHFLKKCIIVVPSGQKPHLRVLYDNKDQLKKILNFFNAYKVLHPSGNWYPVIDSSLAAKAAFGLGTPQKGDAVDRNGPILSSNPKGPAKKK